MAANQTTATKSGRRWATATLAICGLFTIWAQYDWPFMPDWVRTVVVAVFPPVVSFVGSHLVSYMRPKNTSQKVLVWGGFGLIILCAMIGSATHILNTVMQAGQPWYSAITYIFMADAPMLLAGVVLSIKVTGTTQRTTQAKETVTAIPAKATPAPKKAAPVKSTKPVVKAPTVRKSTKPSQTVPKFSISDDKEEMEMLNA